MRCRRWTNLNAAAKMTLKDDIAADIRDVFINLTEFSDWHTVDGVIIACQVSHWTADKSNRQNENYGGLMGDFTTLHFKTADYTGKRERLMRHGEQCYFDGRRYDVVSVKDDMGVAKVVLSAYRQNVLRSGGMADVYGYGQRA